MHEKTKEVPIDGQRYQLSKLDAFDGAMIHWRMMGALLKQAAENAANGSAQEEPPEAVKKGTDEDQAKMLCTTAFMLGLSYEDAQFAQKKALQAVCRIENVSGSDHFIAILTPTGRFVPEEIGNDPALVSRLTIESLAFSLAPFFSKSRSAT